MQLRLGLLFVMLLAVPAHAGGTDFTQPIAGLDGKPFLECKQQVPDKDGKPSCSRTGPVTVGEIAAAALSVPDKNASLDEQVRRAKLAQAVVDAKSYALTADETKRIESCLPVLGTMGMSPLVVYGVVKVIDPASIPK